MKMKWSAFYSLLFLTTLASCGSEQFGTTPQSSTSTADPLKVYEAHSCTNRTLISPKVDIIYVVDNSGSSFNIQDSVKTAVKNTVNSISKDFDYRVIGTTLLNAPGDTTPNDDYRVMTNSNEDALPSEASSRRVFDPSDLTFFTNPITSYAPERGLGRTLEFMEHHLSSGLLRQGAYHLVVLVSNGRDDEVEYVKDGTNLNYPTYSDRYQRFTNLKTGLSSQQLRFMSVTAKTSCEGSKTSNLSYIKMANQLYADSGATDNNSTRDSYDVCSSGLNNLFTAVNSSIQKIVIPHKYRYWPITFAKSTDTRDSFGKVEVYRINGSSAPQLMSDSSWTWEAAPSGSKDIREDSGSEVVSAYHFIRFNDLITYPDCIQVKSVDRTEYFGYIVLQREPKPDTIYVTINGNAIPRSTTNGWEYKGNITRSNIKVPHPDSPGSEEPPIARSGFMIQLHGTSNYYKSGDNVQVNFIPAAI